MEEICFANCSVRLCDSFGFGSLPVQKQMHYLNEQVRCRFALDDDRRPVYRAVFPMLHRHHEQLCTSMASPKWLALAIWLRVVSAGCEGACAGIVVPGPGLYPPSIALYLSVYLSVCLS